MIGNCAPRGTQLRIQPVSPLFWALRSQLRGSGKLSNVWPLVPGFALGALVLAFTFTSTVCSPPKRYLLRTSISVANAATGLFGMATAQLCHCAQVKVSERSFPLSDRAGTFDRRGPRPSAIVGCAMTASRSCG